MPAFDPARPFILFDDAREDREQLVFQNPVRRLVAESGEDIRRALRDVQAAVSEGRWAAGHLVYEAGAAFEPKLALRPPSVPRLHFEIFDAPLALRWPDIAGMLAGRRAEVQGIEPAISEAEHREMIETVLGYIGAGDIYQANATFPVRGAIQGHPLALWDRLRRAQRMAYGCVQHLGGGQWFLSASPELFFEVEGDRITAKPMKGTAARQPTLLADREAASDLAADIKNRAENLMITDLIRNDLSRVAKPGSVSVRNAFEVESFPTVHQMITTVEADLAHELGVADIFAAMFPCGSITGAPKIRASEIIAEIEPDPRGIYTGSFGFLSPDGRAVFNVAIRTMDVSAGRYRMGVGAGIVADSNPAAEWKESLIKASFAASASRPFHLIETMRFDAEDGLQRLDLHMARLKRSAKRLGFVCDTHRIGNLAQTLTGRLAKDRKVRILLAEDGSPAVSHAPLPAEARELKAALVPLPVDPSDIRLAHKTSDRGFYESARREGGADEAILVREDGLVTEGTFTNVFLKRGGTFLTPTAGLGLLPGVLREEMLASGEAVEAELSKDDLSDGELFLGNSVRGLVPAVLVEARGSA